MSTRLQATSGGWAVRRLTPGLRGYVLGIPAAAVLLAVLEVRGTAATAHDGLLAGLLLVMGAVSVEATRRVGRPAGTLVKDLLSVWWLPAAVLLPPAYALLLPLPLLALAQWRVPGTLPHRRIFSAGCIGLAYGAVSAGYHAWSVPAGAPLPAELPRWAAQVAAVGVLAAAANAALVAVAVRTADPQIRWRELLGGAEQLQMEAVETCAGVITALLIDLNPLLVVFMLPPVLLLQRGLLHAQLRAAAMLDVKTGLLNAPTWEREAGAALLTAGRRRQPCSMLLIDIDHFKNVNDAYGHLAGDDVLRAVATALQSGLREGDLLGRFGGEEFAVLLPATNAVETDRITERLRRLIAGMVVVLPQGQAVGVTVSIGVAATATGALSVLDLLAAADRCMYQAKASGRNQVVPPAVSGT